MSKVNLIKHLNKGNMDFKNTFVIEDLYEENEIISLLTKNDEEKMEQEHIPQEVAILPLRHNVLFPGCILPITVSRKKSKKLVQEVFKKKDKIGVVVQKKSQVEDPLPEDLYQIGSLATILRIITLPDDRLLVILKGRSKFQIEEIVATTPFMLAKVKRLEDFIENTEIYEAFISSIEETATNLIKKNPNISDDILVAIKNIESKSYLINFILSNLSISFSEKQTLLETPNKNKQAEKVLLFLESELRRLEIKNDIQSKVKDDLHQQQREYFLQQQMRTIQEELGGVNFDQDFEEMRVKGNKKKWTEEIAGVFKKELNRFQRMNTQAAEYSIQRNYLELLLDLPWGEYTKDNFDLKRAKKILDSYHHGLEKVKERVIVCSLMPTLVYVSCI